jgi:RNA polymerase sigma-70 factor (ECF subfamily)
MALAPTPLRLVEPSASDTCDSAQLSDAELFDRFSPYVARIGMRLLGRNMDVDDLVQEVFFAAFKQREQLRDPAAAKSWLSVVAVRAARRELRRRRVRQFIGLDSPTPPFELQDQTLSPDKRSLLSRVYEVLDRMDVDDRLAWTLRHVEGEKLEQVAERCGCSLATAKRRISAAHVRLQAELHSG